MSQLRRPETRYARSGDVSVAYQVLGDGPPDLVYVWGTYSHVELHWEEPAVARHLRRLASFARLITFDKRGTGLSDSVAGVPTMEERMDDIRAVMDAAGSEHAVLMGLSEGATLAALFAAAYPERAAGLVLYGGIASFVRRPDYPWRPPADEERRRIDTLAQTMHQDWGIPERFATMLQRGAPSLAGDEGFTRWFATFMRLAYSPAAYIAHLRMNLDLDIRHVLPAIRVPTLVLHRTGDRIARVEEGRYLAAHIPGARLVELPGDDHIPWVGDTDAVLDEIEEFVTGVRPDREPDRVLATVLFTDIVDSTNGFVKK